ncbi:MAG: twin-arginine translocase subunit TatC [Bacteroidia bacterium]
MAKDKPKESAEMSFLDHLEALRWHLIRAAIAIVLFGSLAFIFKDVIFDGILLAPKYDTFPTYRFFCNLSQWLFHDDSICLKDLNFELISIQMSGQFSAHITIAFITGLILSFPYLLWEVWRFIKPALYDKERKAANGMVFWSSLLFALGISFGYFVITPLSVYFFGNYQVSELVKNQISLNSFISTVASTTFGAGIIFELPIVIYFLAKAGLTGPAFLRKTRKVAYVLILILSAIITPPDVTSQIIVSIPVFLLYEISIYLAARVEKQRLKS